MVIAIIQDATSANPDAILTSEEKLPYNSDSARERIELLKKILA